MATKDKKTPTDHKLRSSSKWAKAKTTASVGAPVKAAAGAKKVKPGDGSKPAAKTVKAYDTQAAKTKRAKALNSAATRKLGIQITPPIAMALRQQKGRRPTDA